MEKYAVILAGGSGRRAGGDMPKQFRLLSGRPVVWWSMKAFHDADPEIRIVLVVHPGFFDDWHLIFDALPDAEKIPHVISCGGRDRPESVKNGLLTVRDECQASGEDPLIFIHDGARPLVTPEMILRGMLAWQPCEGVIPVVPSVSSLRELRDSEVPLVEAESRSVDRSRYVEVQTPQIFRFSTIAALYFRNADLSHFTDDASVAEHAGVRIRLYRGDTFNIKVTNPEDFVIAEALIKFEHQD
ncbi:MAG: 2-C-methyl-D-erythritol 4-phosphate cytidylyltransferase [Muribaculaceae bacterium]|nr:2-C-methyl-D-erythritol 4-phosphate cytidylyltransferase [Muribaculaceae bacterium]